MFHSSRLLHGKFLPWSNKAGWSPQRLTRNDLNLFSQLYRFSAFTFAFSKLLFGLQQHKD
jgi:hypothetical protein